MINAQLVNDVLLVLAVLFGLTTALSAVMLVAPSLSRPARPSHPPRGGLRRDLPRQPQPEPEPQPELQLQTDTEEDRELVLV